MPAHDPSAWYVVACVDCGKRLKSRGAPVSKPICLHCDVIRAAPEDQRESIRTAVSSEIMERFAHIEISEGEA